MREEEEEVEEDEEEVEEDEEEAAGVVDGTLGELLGRTCQSVRERESERESHLCVLTFDPMKFGGLPVFHGRFSSYSI